MNRCKQAKIGGISYDHGVKSGSNYSDLEPGKEFRNPVPTANRNDDALYKSLFTYLKLSFMFSVGVCVSTAGRMSSGQPRYNTE